MSEPLVLIARSGMSPFVAVLAAEGVELVGYSTDDAFDGLLAFLLGYGDHRDVIFVLQSAVRERPFVVLVDCTEKRFLSRCLAENLVANARAG